MNVVTEMKMPLWAKEYKRLVSGEDCQVEAKKAIRQLLERSMEEALRERMNQGGDANEALLDRRNGYYERSLLTSFGYITEIKVPRGRVTSIADVVLPKYRRRQPEFDAAVVESYLLGHSTRKSKRFLTEFLGELGISHTTVSRILQRLDERAAAWRKRPLEKPFVYLWLDAKYARIQGATKRPYAVLFAYGATEQGERELLGFQIQRSEGTAHWECMLAHLVSRGLPPDERRPLRHSGCLSSRRRRRDQAGLPPTRQEVPPGPKSRRSRGGGAIQGGARGLRDPDRSGTATALRPTRGRRPGITGEGGVSRR